MKTILEVKNLYKKFTLHLLNKKEIIGCQEISFSLKKGEFLGVFGPSGMGKSTILKCIYRSYLPTGGQIIYNSLTDGKVDLVAANEQEIINLRNEEINYLTQFLEVIPRVSAQDIVAEGLIKKGMSSQNALIRARDLLNKLQIPEELWDAYPSTFSGGEKQRVNIARSIIDKPGLLLLDEPTASLNKELQELVLDLLIELKEEGTTMIGIFHNIEFMRKIADYELSMLDNKVSKVSREDNVAV
ncbi:MAG: phosphonate C-P lyase system protein PhnL [Halanaerobiaceae bacterium]